MFKLPFLYIQVVLLWVPPHPALFSAPINTYHFDQLITLQALDKNASGVTFLPNSTTLLVVVDDPEALCEYTLSGKLLRQIRLKSFKDTEAVVHLGQDFIAIAEEGRMRISTFEMTPELAVLDRDDCSSFYVAPPLDDEHENKGIEGLAFSADKNRLIAVKEAKPRAMYSVSSPLYASQRVVGGYLPGALEKIPLLDLSGLHLRKASGTLLVVSDESRLMQELDEHGTVLSELSLQKGSAGLPKSIKKAEGVTEDHAGRIYIVGEPNLLFRFKPQK